MKKIIIFSSLVCIMSFLISCEKNIIDLQPLDQMTYSKAISTIDGLEGSILGVYFQGRFIYASNDYCLYKVAETDLVQPGSNVTDQPIFNAIITFNLFDATSTGVSDIWNGYYSGLNRCNSILANIDNVAVSPSDVANKNTVKGEAYYFRAYFHMQLVERWDNIVLANQVFSNPDATMKLAQKSDVYALIVSDLQQAITLLPEASSIDNRGRATKGVARHLLSKAYMDLGSLTSDASYWPKAAAMAVAVINDPAYVLLTDLTQIFIDENQDNSEIIFSWQFSKSDNSNVERCCQQMFPLYDRVVGVARTFADGGRPWARMVPSDYYWTLFDPNDKRLNAWHKRYWVYDATPLPATGVQLGDTVTVANMGTPKVTYPAASLIMPTTNKYLEDGFLGRALGDAQGYRDIIQWRKSEAYIIAAEAYMRMGDNATGVSYLNVLRDRAGVRDFAAGELNQDLILDEQARELGHEGVRWEMLKRLGILYNRVQTYSPTVGANMQPFHVRWPIPKAFVDLTKVPQNQGYE